MVVFPLAWAHSVGRSSHSSAGGNRGELAGPPSSWESPGLRMPTGFVHPWAFRRWRRPTVRSEEAELLRAVAHQQVLGLLVVLQHHAVGLTADPRLLVAAERRVGGIGVIAVGPDASGFDTAPHPVAGVHIPAPDTGPQAVKRVVR